ncbi:HAD family hydrolase [Pseudoruegeria sp. HB172150]|uniref:HAD family hydrolase n=1 Tax=Pseudoruegeria sp. HB172150 TaxID=2721164 RepID=UPI0015538A95|nr:HAD family hydrolase [Pseudoruegeria sp. HB172150]
MTAIRGVLFDKDGTLFDFEATWSAWAATMLLDFAGGDAERATSLGDRIGFDYAARRFDPLSPVIAGTPDELVALLGPGVPEFSPDELVARLNATAAAAPLVEAVPLKQLIAELRSVGLKLGVATNDAEVPARAHLAAVGQEDAFDFIAGYDSGFGGKPEPGMCLAFARAVDLSPSSIAMVGDSTHDLVAGRAAGMRCIAVLTGMAEEEDLAPLADAVLPSIGYLSDWIAAQNRPIRT